MAGERAPIDDADAVAVFDDAPSTVAPLVVASGKARMATTVANAAANHLDRHPRDIATLPARARRGA
ncbi:MAG TPA: hypothetical protein VMD59_14870 [Acidimicrobiales bacterium]|nr:hypothetical protein [Acidimicrobiales bacterium]